MRAMINSSVPWLFRIPEDWSIERCKYNFQYHKNIVGNEANRYDRLALTMNGVIKRSKEDLEGLQPKDFEGYQVVNIGDLVFKLIDLDGKSTSRVGLSPYNGLVSPAYILLHALNGVDKEFATYYFLSMWHRYIFNEIGNGGIRSSLNSGDLLEVPILKPSVEEQRAIVAFLDSKCAAINEAIERHKKIIEKLSMFLTETIANATLHGISNSEMKTSGVEWIAQFPESWDVKRGKYLFLETNERSVDGNEELLTVSQYTGITPRSQKNVNMFEAESLVGYKICEVNDIPANTMWLWAGAIGVSSYRGLISPSYNVYRQIDNQYDNMYLDYLLRATPLVQHYKALSTGIRPSRLRLYPDQFLNIKYPIPPMAEQKAIAAFLDDTKSKVEESISRQTSAIDKLEEYRKSIIYQAVTGKIDCRDKA